jgi:hypothetical protein
MFRGCRDRPVACNEIPKLNRKLSPNETNPNASQVRGSRRFFGAAFFNGRFVASVFTNSSESLTHLSRESALSTASASTKSNPFMPAFPKVIGLAPGHLLTSACLPPSKRAMKSPLLVIPTLMLPLIMKATPPNIFLGSAFAPSEVNASATRCSNSGS